jgi:hypothetical protein
MRSAVARGQAAKLKTKRWFEGQGYVVAFLERVLWIQGKSGLVPCKKDQYGADLEAKSETCTVYAQVKSGTSARSQLAAARREFAKYPLDGHDQQWIVVWLPRAREPEVIVVAVGPQRADRAVVAPPRKKPKVLPLFAAAGR